MDDSTWTAIEQERRSLADFLDGLSSQQWDARSLCREWRVRDVAAHLAMTPAGQPGLGTLARALAANRGDLWGAGRDVAIAYAQRPPGELVDAVRASAGARRKPVFVVDQNILLDLLVHGQDIAVPLGLHRPVDPRFATVALDRIWAMGWPFRARRRLAGVRLRAADADWERGEGPEVIGGVADLLLLTTGRTDAALARLAGAGTHVIRAKADARTG
ncbi:MAG: maleylpyruvate isomerase family mycothiol-dependent enzyme [Propionibacteriaceae bacterium]